MKKIGILFAIAIMAVACHPREKVLSYEDVEQQFQSSLTDEDSTKVLMLTDAFMQMLKNGSIDLAVEQVNTIYEGKLYKASDDYMEELRTRFNAFPVVDYELVRFSFSTQANNDVCYRYYFDETHTMKLVFNPVKIDGEWFIALKDGDQSSKDKDINKQVNPRSVAPEEITLNRK